MNGKWFWLPVFALLAACTTGSHPPAVVGRVRAPIDFHAVRIYTERCAPPRYETVARLDGSKLGLFSSYRFNLRWIKMLRAQAAGLGANALLVAPVSSAAMIGPDRHGPAFRVLAIWEPPSSPHSPGTAVTGAEPACSLTAKELSHRVFHGWGPRAQGGGDG